MLNRAQLIGNLGQDPEIRTTSEGKQICALSLATTESWKDKYTGEKKDVTDWHKVVIFNEKIVEFCKNYAKKGSRLYIEGQIKTRKYQNQNESKERYITEIILSHNGILKILDSKQEAAKPFHEPKETGEKNDFGTTNWGDDEIPF